MQFSSFFRILNYVVIPLEFKELNAAILLIGDMTIRNIPGIR